MVSAKTGVVIENFISKKATSIKTNKNNINNSYY